MSNSNSPIVAKEKLSAYQRWELNSFDVAAAQPAAQAQTPKNNGHELDQRAYQQGHADALREGAVKTSADAENLRALLTSVNKYAESMKPQLGDDLIELALEIARRMVHEALDVRRELIVPIVQDAIAHLVRPLVQPILTVHPQDAALVREHLGEQLAVEGWKVIEDETIVRGGCKLKTLASQADATVACRWQRLTAALGKSMPWIK